VRARKQVAANGKLDGSALTLRRARAPASKLWRRRLVTSSGLLLGRCRSRERGKREEEKIQGCGEGGGGCAPPPVRVETERGGGANDARVWGEPALAGFVPAKIAAGRQM